MVKRNKIIFYIFLILSFSAGFYYYKKTNLISQKPNILIISVCSLGLDYLPIYTDFELMPNLKKFTEQSSLYAKSVSTHPWLPFIRFFSDIHQELRKNNYTSLMPNGWLMFRQPISVARYANEDSNESYLDYQERISDLKKLLTQKREKPFFVNVYIKYLHSPYFDNINLTLDDYKNKLSPDNFRLLNKYIKSPINLDKSIFLNLLFGDRKVMDDYLTKVLKVNKSTTKKVRNNFWLNIDPAAIDKWKNSEGFKEDLELLKQVYQIKLTKLDEMLAPVLSLWGNSELKNNTLIMIDSDHGEGFMQHGFASHSSRLYEEFISMPLIVAFPGNKKAIELKSQLSKTAAANAIIKVMKGDVAIEKIISDLQNDSANEYIVSRNCRNTVYSIRTKDAWKLIINYEENTRELFNLNVDKSELNNIYSEHGDIALHLESVLEKEIQRLDKPMKSLIGKNECFKDEDLQSN